MSRPPRRGSAAATATPIAAEDRHQVPGTYERQTDGTFLRTDEPTEMVDADRPRLPSSSARAIDEALTDLGHDCPPHIREDAGETASPAASAGSGEALPPTDATEPKE